MDRNRILCKRKIIENFADIYKIYLGSICGVDSIGFISRRMEITLEGSQQMHRF